MPHIDNLEFNDKVIKLTLLQVGYSGIILKLIEGSLQHVLRIYLFNPQEVKDHIVGEVKGTVEWIRLTLNKTKNTNVHVHVCMYTCTL